MTDVAEERVDALGPVGAERPDDVLEPTVLEDARQDAVRVTLDVEPFDLGVGKQPAERVGEHVAQNSSTRFLQSGVVRRVDRSSTDRGRWPDERAAGAPCSLADARIGHVQPD